MSKLLQAAKFVVHPLLTALIPVAILIACGAGPKEEPELTQFSTIGAILAGSYDGSLPSGDLLNFGDTGIGTFHALDGEMIINRGKVYQVKADGKVYQPSSEVSTPFATVVRFNAGEKEELAETLNMTGLTEHIEGRVASKNFFYAIRLQGKFTRMTVRSVPAQQPPYPPLVEVTREQPVFEYQDVSGTLVGFRSPAFAAGLNVPGYHLHFLSDDEQAGGHVLDFELKAGLLETEEYHRIQLLLPGPGTPFAASDLSGDRSNELEEAEK